jgi:UDPglucose 6-dehydrogenase
MHLSVVGCGYLGAVHSAAMAELGHTVTGIDVDADKINMLNSAKPTFFEPGLPEILASAIKSGRLKFSTDIADAAGASVHFIAVGTPQMHGGNAADLTYVYAAFESLLPHLSEGDLVVGKSTVPVGTATRLSGMVESRGATLAWNPEFLREGFAVQDTISPDRLVYGVSGDSAVAVGALNKVYASAIAAGTPLVVTDYATAELVKVAANAFLATKISFINAMSEIADLSGANVTELADAIGHDSRIGRRFLNAGVGFGGGCLPKDIRAFTARAEELGAGDSVSFLKEVDAINLRQRQRLVNIVMDALGGSVFGKKVAVLGLAFKPNSDDVRDSPALDVAVQLKGLGANVVATDPQAIVNAQTRHPQLAYSSDVEVALQGANLVLLVTEWAEYVAMDPRSVGQLVNERTIVDGRNALDSSLWRDAGWNYTGMGKP